MENARNSLCRKQWTIFMRKQWTILVNAENRFYECGKQIRIYSNNATQFMLLVACDNLFKYSNSAAQFFYFGGSLV